MRKIKKKIKNILSLFKKIKKYPFAKNKYIKYYRKLAIKENYILYPTALEAIKDEKLWENMREKCDDIGYCPFTPKECIKK